MKKIIVTVAEGQQDINEVANRLASAGMQVDQVLGTSGIITGSVADHLHPSIGLVDGVGAVEADSDIQLPPPNSPVQ